MLIYLMNKLLEEVEDMCRYDGSVVQDQGQDQGRERGVRERDVNIGMGVGVGNVRERSKRCVRYSSFVFRCSFLFCDSLLLFCLLDAIFSFSCFLLSMPYCVIVLKSFFILLTFAYLDILFFVFVCLDFSSFLFFSFYFFRSVFLTRFILFISLYRTYGTTRTRLPSSASIFVSVPGNAGTVPVLIPAPHPTPLPAPTLATVHDPDAPDLIAKHNKNGDGDGKMSMELAIPLMPSSVISISVHDSEGLEEEEEDGAGNGAG